MFRQALAVGLSALLAAPVWAMPSAPAGTVATSNGATVSGAAAAVGTSVYSGDTVAVAENGGASVILMGGSRVLVGSGTEARVVRAANGFSLDIARGGVAFTSSSKSPVQGELADLTFRPANPGQDAAGTLTFKGSNRALLVANRGDWIVTTAHDGRSMVLRSGEEIEATVGTSPAPNDQDQQNKKRKRRLAAFLIGGSIVAGTTGLALAFGQSECTNPLQLSCNKPISGTTP